MTSEVKKNPLCERCRRPVKKGERIRFTLYDLYGKHLEGLICFYCAHEGNKLEVNSDEVAIEVWVE